MAPSKPDFSASQPAPVSLQALLRHVKKLETQVKKMRKQFRPQKLSPSREASIPLLPATSSSKIFLYFNNVVRRPIFLVKSMLRDGYSIDCRGVVFSFVGKAVLEVLINEERSDVFIQEMRRRGHPKLSSDQAYSGLQVHLKGTLEECRHYAMVACQRRWTLLRSQVKDKGSVAAYEMVLQKLGEEIARAIPAEESARVTVEVTSQESTANRKRPRVHFAEDPIIFDSAHSIPSTPSSPSFQHHPTPSTSFESNAKPDTTDQLMGLKKGFFSRSREKGLFG